MKRVFGMFAVLLAVMLAACGGNSASGPSRVSTTQQQPAATDLSSEFDWAVEMFPSGLTVNMYGNIQLAMDTPVVDPTGGSIRLRVYDDSGKVHTYQADYGNSKPVGGTNDTFFGEGVIQLANVTRVDMAAVFQPRASLCGGQVTPACWHLFTFPNRAVVRLIPQGQYSLNQMGSEVRLQGAMPQVNQGRSTGLHTLEAGGAQLDRVPLGPWREID